MTPFHPAYGPEVRAAISLFRRPRMPMTPAQAARVRDAGDSAQPAQAASARGASDSAPLNKRQLAKAATREKVLAAARALFANRLYDQVDIRSIAQHAGMSTAAVFSGFSGKAELWREAMGTEPPTDSALTRAAPALRDALTELLEVARLADEGVCDARARAAEAAAERALEAAARPLGPEIDADTADAMRERS